MIKKNKKRKPLIKLLKLLLRRRTLCQKALKPYWQQSKISQSNTISLNDQLTIISQHVIIIISKKYYSLKECKELVNQYVKENKLDEGATHRGCIRFDPILVQIVDKKFRSHNENDIRKDQLY